jgi:hypothetical protein
VSLNGPFQGHHNLLRESLAANIFVERIGGWIRIVYYVILVIENIRVISLQKVVSSSEQIHGCITLSLPFGGLLQRTNIEKLYLLCLGGLLQRTNIEKLYLLWLGGLLQRTKIHSYIILCSACNIHAAVLVFFLILLQRNAN